MQPINTKQAINRLLAATGSSGIMGQTVQASTPLQALETLQLFDSKCSPETKKRLVHELKRQKLISFAKSADTITVQLSVKGIHRLQQHEIESMTIPKIEPWDNKWRLVMFDIPARHADSRYALTSNLRRLGFRMVQHSCWVHAYPCFEVIDRLLTYTNLKQFVSMTEITHLDSRSTNQLKRHFKELL